MRLHNILQIYSFYVDKLLKENKDYYAISYTISNNFTTRAVFSFKKPPTLQELRLLRKEMITDIFDSNSRSAVAIDKLKDLEEQIKIVESGKQKPNPFNKITDFEEFKRILVAHNKEVEKHILKGETFNLRNHLGYIAIRRVERNPEKLTPNWGETMKLKAKYIAEGKELFHPVLRPNGYKYMVFYTDEYWYRIGWTKMRTVKNHTVYQFSPAGGCTEPGYKDKPKGLRQKMSRAVRTDPTLKMKVKFYPYIHKPKPDGIQDGVQQGSSSEVYSEQPN